MSPVSPDVEVAVVGAGVAGLAAALELETRGHRTAVFESGRRVGGVAWSEQRDGFLFERGPNTFRLRPEIVPFFERYRLFEHIERAAPASRKRWLLRGGELQAVPDGPLAFVRTPLLSLGGKLRLLGEPFAPRRRAPEPESVAEFVTRRLGAEPNEALVGPFLTGVYAGDERELGAEAVFPSLVAAERARGSVTLGLALGRKGPRAPAGSWSGRRGVGGLVDALGAGLPETPRTGVRCRGLRLVDAGVELALEGHDRDTLVARAVVIAAPAPAAAGILRRALPDAATLLESVDYAPVVNLSVGVARDATRTPVEGFGFLVPRGEAPALLGCLFPSQLFAGRAPADAELLTAFAGGARRPELIDVADDQLLDALLSDLDAALGFREAPRELAITRWPAGIPQPDRHHVRRMDALADVLAAHPTLALAGGYLSGVAVSDALLSGLRAAERLSATLHRRETS